MKRLLTALFAICTSMAFGQHADNFFTKEKLSTQGVYYYPEQWSENQWDRDIKNIADMGFEYIHVAEFAWAIMEPQEGKYDFTWLDKVVAIADKYHLQVLMCTPTPCPPAWLATKHPEIFAQNSDYHAMEHGSRSNGSTSSTVFRAYTDKIVAQLAMHYGKDKRIIGWQLDNEPARGTDYHPDAQKQFRVWLKNKYKTIAALNRVWGGAFWSFQFNSFEEINIPSDKLAGVSPHALLDSKRFVADQLAGFLDAQAIVLRKYISPKQWIMTNYMGMGNNNRFDPSRTHHLDFSCYTNYPVHGSGEMLGDKGFRIGSMSGLAFLNDYHRSLYGTYGVMELQPGQVNWGDVNPQPEPGAVNMWLWHTFAGGTVLNCTYRYRHPIYGSELYHAGIVGTDGVTPSPGGNEFAAYIADIKKLRSLYDPSKKVPVKYSGRKTAILENLDNLWDQDILKQSIQWDPMEHMLKYFRICKSFGAPVDFVRETGDWSAYKVLIVPAYQMVDAVLIKKIQSFADAGGLVIITCRTGQKDKDGHLWEAKPSQPLYELIGAEIPFHDQLLPSGNAHVSFDKNDYAWNNWADILAPFSGTETLGIYTSEFYKGRSAITSRKAGKGSVIYIGVDTDDASLEKEVLHKAYTDAGINIENYPAGIDVEYRDGFWIAVNYSSNEYQLNLPVNSKIIAGSKGLTSPGVCVWMEP